MAETLDGVFLTQKGLRTACDDLSIEELQDFGLEIEFAESQDARILRKKKELREADALIEEMKAQYRKRMEKCMQRSQELDMKRLEMIEQMKKFEKFVLHNDRKREKAEAKIRQEIRLQHEKEEEIRKLSEKFSAALLVEHATKEQNLKLQIYKTFLSSAIKTSDQGFETIEDLLNRFYNLQKMNDTLTQHCEEVEIQIEKRRNKTHDLIQGLQDAVLIHNSTLNVGHQELEAARNTVKNAMAKNESEVEHIKSIIRETGEVTAAVQNLYVRSKSSVRKSLPEASAGDEKQRLLDMSLFLEIIGDRICDLKDIKSGYCPHS